MEENDTKTQPRTSWARAEAQKLLKKTKINNFPLNFRVLGDHIKSTLNIDLMKTSEFSDEVSGVTIVGRHGGVIVFNENHPWVRRRFTIAHEIGHLIMGTGHTSIRGATDDKNPIETEANAFAAELLLPKTELKNSIAGGLKVPEIAEKYLVSEEVVGWSLARIRF